MLVVYFLKGTNRQEILVSSRIEMGGGRDDASSLSWCTAAGAALVLIHATERTLNVDTTDTSNNVHV